jgi:hypothetical protein
VWLWAADHLDAVERARRTFDAAHQAGAPRE